MADAIDKRTRRLNSAPEDYAGIGMEASQQKNLEHIAHSLWRIAVALEQANHLTAQAGRAKKG